MLVNQARDDKELKKMLLLPLKYAVDILLDKILEANIDAINKVVYYDEMGTPKCYENTYEFLKAWDKAVHTTKVIGHDIQGSFFYKPSNMETSNPPYIGSDGQYHMGQHHGIGEDRKKGEPRKGKYWGDSREYLADIIYQGIKGEKIFGDGPWTKKRDAFSELVRVVGKRNFNKWFQEAMQEVGLNVKSHGGIIRKDEK